MARYLLMLESGLTVNGRVWVQGERCPDPPVELLCLSREEQIGRWGRVMYEAVIRSVDDLIPGYDSLARDKILEAARALSPVQRLIVKAYEERNKKRAAVLRDILAEPRKGGKE